MDLGLGGKRALVTGGSRGIGHGIADALLREGCAVVVVVSSQPDALERTRAELALAHDGAEVVAHAADLGKAKVVDELAALFPDTDILVNCAGAIPHGALDQVSDANWLEGWDLKVYGTIRLTRALYRAMAGRRQGVIVNIIGYAGERPMARYIAGSSGNAALMAFTRALGSASPDDNVRVVGVNPGHILTERTRARLVRRAAEESGDANQWEGYMRTYPFGRAGSVAEVADTVAFLSSPRAGYISGTVVTVDGGMANRPAAI